MKDDLVRFGVAMDAPLLSDLDALVEERGGTRSELLRDLVRGEVSRAKVRDAVDAMQQSGVRRLLVVDADGGVIGLVSSDDLLAAVSEELEGLARALRASIKREQSARKVISTPSGPRPVFPSFGTAAVQ